MTPYDKPHCDPFQHKFLELIILKLLKPEFMIPNIKFMITNTQIFRGILNINSRSEKYTNHNQIQYMCHKNYVIQNNFFVYFLIRCILPLIQ